MELPSDFFIDTGKVIKATKETVSQVKSVGGGGAISQGSGYISAPITYSTSSVVWDLWLQRNQGEKDYQVKGQDIPVRESQILSILLYRGALVKIYNHNTQKLYALLVGSQLYPEKEKRDTSHWTWNTAWFGFILVAPFIWIITFCIIALFVGPTIESSFKNFASAAILPTILSGAPLLYLAALSSKMSAYNKTVSAHNKKQNELAIMFDEETEIATEVLQGHVKNYV